MSEEKAIEVRNIVDIRSATAEEIEDLEAIVLETDRRLQDSTRSLNDLEESLKQLNHSKSLYDASASKVKDQMRKAMKAL